MKKRADTWITTDPPVVEGADRLSVALERMAARGLGLVLVCEGDRLAGIFTGRDLLRLFAPGAGRSLQHALEAPIRDFMTPNPICVDTGDDYDTIYLKMKTRNVRHIPVLDGGRLVGIVSRRDILRFYQNRLETEYNEARAELESLKELIGGAERDRFAALFGELQRYRELSLTDHLTGLFNKRYFQTRIMEEVTRARRYGEELSLIFCDIDYFKKINDLYGHQQGDKILRETACLLSGTVDELHVVSRLRKSDIIARYGGEEFVIILPETGQDGAVVAAEKLRRVVEEHPFLVAGRDEHLTMSFGVATLGAEDRSPEQIIRNADTAMYLAKNGGRNRVVAHRRPG